MSTAFDDPRIQQGMKAQFEKRQARLDSGEAHVGWKVGFGTQAAMEKLGTDMPLVGYITDKVMLSPGDTVDVSGWNKPAVEPEIAVYIDQDLPANADRETTADAIAAISPAFEIVDIYPPPEEIEAILADNIFNRHVILGDPDTSRPGADLSGIVGRITRKDGPLDPVSEIEVATGNFLDVVAHTATLFAQHGEVLRAGDFIIMGSIAGLLWITEDETINYHLDPVGELSVILKA